MSNPILDAYDRIKGGANDPILAAFDNLKKNTESNGEWTGSRGVIPATDETKREVDLYKERYAKYAAPMAESQEPWNRMFGRVGNNLSGLASMMAHPVDALAGIRDNTADKLVDAQMRFRDGDYAGAAASGITAIPIVGQGIESAARDITSGNLMGLAGDAVTGQLLVGAGKGVHGIAKRVPDIERSVGTKLRRGGESIYRGAMKPKSEVAAEKVLPRMIDEGITNGTDLTPRLDEAKYRIAQVEAKHAATPHDIQPIVADLERLKGPYLAETGSVLAGGKTAVSEIAKVQRSLSTASRAGNVSTSDLVKQRRILDDIAEGKGAFKTLDPATGAALAGDIANVLRERLNAIDDIFTANSEYSYLKSADQILREAPHAIAAAVSHGVAAGINLLRGFKGAAGVGVGRAALAPGVRARVGIGMDRLGRAMHGEAEYPSSAFIRNPDMPEIGPVGSPMPLFEGSESGMVRPANSMAEGLAGYSSSDLLQQMFEESLRRDVERQAAGASIAKSAEAISQRALPAGSPPVMAATPDGRVAPSSPHAEPLRGAMSDPTTGGDVFGYHDAVARLQSQVTSADPAVARQQIASKVVVYVDPTGAQIAVPKGVFQSFVQNYGSTGVTAVQRWMEAMRKQGKIKAGGRLIFIDP